MICMTVEQDGFKFELLLGAYDHGGSIVLSNESPLSDPLYITALKQVQSLLPYYQTRGYLESELHEYYYKGDYSNDPRLMMIVKAYQEKIIPISDELYAGVVSWMNGKAYLVTHPPKNPIVGYTYLMADSSGLYKIGFSSDPSTRLKKVTSKTNPVTLVCQIASDRSNFLEYDLHKMFHDFRVKGEWFQLAPDDVEYIKGLANVTSN